MRVLLLSWEYPPRIHGGLGRHVHGLARALVRDGHAVHVVAAGHPAAAQDAVVDGVRVLRAGVDRGATEAPSIDGWVEQVLVVNRGIAAVAAGCATGTPYDVVHAHDWLVAPALGALLAAAPMPVVATIHATERGRHQGWLPGPMSHWIHEVERWLTATAGAVVVCSRAMREQVVGDLSVPRDRLRVIPNGVELPTPDPASARAWRERLAPGGEPLVAYAGRLEHEKGVHILLAAVRRLRSGGLPIRAVVAGDGTQRTRLESLRRRLRLVRAVSFPGFLDGAALAALLAAADVTAVPSLYEPFGMVALESMAAGTPVVASSTGGLAEVVTHERTGLLSAPGDVAGLAAGIRRIVDEPALATELGCAGRRHAAGRGWGIVAQRTAAAYAAAAAAGPRRPHPGTPPEPPRLA